MSGHDGGDEEGISGWLVLWGPLIIMGMLILVFMGDEREGPMTATPMAPQPAPSAQPAPAPVRPVAATLEPVEISPQQAAADLAEAFKAAGIALPEPTAQTARAPAAASEPSPPPGLPPELQANPWAPPAGQPPVGAVPQPPGYGYPYFPPPGYPPPGYYPYAPPAAYYGYGGWGPPPGYAPPPGYGAMPHMVPGYGGQHMRQGGMGPGVGHPMMHGQHHPMMQPQTPSQPGTEQEGAEPPPPPSSN